MRERLSSKFVTFNKVLGVDFYDEFFREDGRPKHEQDIESVYNKYHRTATNFAVIIDKKDAPIRGITDGFGSVFIREGEKLIVNFNVLQETKVNVKRFSVPYVQQIKQGLLYRVQYNSIAVTLFPSIHYIDYMFTDENTEILTSIRPILLDNLSMYSPSTGCKKLDFDVNCLKLHRIDMPTPADISKMWHDIICHCIEI